MGKHTEGSAPAESTSMERNNKKGRSATGGSINMMAMAILIVTTILSLRGLPAEAKYGVQSIFYYLFAALAFLVPFSLVCAELASTFPRPGGLYRWVSEAFGPRWGWTAMFLEWQTIVIWFPTVLMFGAAALAYIFWSDSFDNSLVSDKYYTFAIAMILYWWATFNAFRGQKSANRLSTLGGTLGTVIPGLVLILLAVLYVATGKPVHLAHEEFFPDFSNAGTVVLAASIFLFYAGMEMQAVHINEMRNPSRDYPRAVAVAVVICVVLYSLGTLAVGVVIPSDDINLLQSLLVSYRALWKAFDLAWMGNIMALFIMFGVVGQISALVTGPSTGLMVVAQSGYLPRAIQRANRNGVNTRLLYIQGAFIVILSLLLVVLPTVESAYQIMSQMATVVYLTLVVMIYLAFIRLRRTQPFKKRGFRIPGGKAGEIIVSVVGISGALLAMALSFIPPAQITTGSDALYFGIILGGASVIVALPLVIYSCRKPSWRNPASDIYPFDWQIERRKPGEVSKWAPGYEPSPQEVEDAVRRSE